MGYDNNSRQALGDIDLDIRVGPVVSKMTFKVMSISPSYNLLLGRPWIHKLKVVPSTYHQCLKLMVGDDLVVVQGEPFSLCNKIEAAKASDKPRPAAEAEDVYCRFDACIYTGIRELFEEEVAVKAEFQDMDQDKEAVMDPLEDEEKDLFEDAPDHFEDTAEVFVAEEKEELEDLWDESFLLDCNFETTNNTTNNTQAHMSKEDELFHQLLLLDQLEKPANPGLMIANLLARCHYKPGRGLGARGQGIKFSLKPNGKFNKWGLGYSPRDDGDFRYTDVSGKYLIPPILETFVRASKETLLETHHVNDEVDDCRKEPNSSEDTGSTVPDLEGILKELQELGISTAGITPLTIDMENWDEYEEYTRWVYTDSLEKENTYETRSFSRGGEKTALYFVPKTESLGKDLPLVYNAQVVEDSSPLLYLTQSSLFTNPTCSHCGRCPKKKAQ